MIEDMDSIIRYYPSVSSSAHYSAIQLEKGILQVKTPEGPVKKRFTTCEEWCETLPGKPKVENLSMMLHIIKPEWNVPEVSTAFGWWFTHIYNCIRQTNPEFMKRDDMRTAYNAMVNAITSQIRMKGIYHGCIRYYPTMDYDCLNLEVNSYFCSLSDLYSGYEAIDIIQKAYRPLYELMLPEVIPFITKRVRIPILDKAIDDYTITIARVKAELENLKRLDALKRPDEHFERLIRIKTLHLDIYNNELTSMMSQRDAL